MTITLEKTIAITPEPLPTQRMVIAGSWEQFELLQQGFAQSKRVRLSYYDGTIEIIIPGQVHELFKKIIAMMVEAYLLDRGLEFLPTGSMTQKVDEVAAAEADESYVVGEFRLSIELCLCYANEVTVTSSDDSKLQIYKALGVNEVWFWEDGVLEIHHLIDGEYDRVQSSQIPELSGIDRAVLAKCVLMGETSRVQAIGAFRSAHPLIG